MTGSAHPASKTPAPAGQANPEGCNLVQAGEPILVLTEHEKRFLLVPRPGGRFHCHIGIIEHDELIGRAWGTEGLSHSGGPYLVLRPCLEDLMLHLKRATQVIYPKDAALLIQRLGIKSGSSVLEAGTGSGVMTTALAWTVAPHGRVVTCEQNDAMYQQALRNLERTGLARWVDARRGHLADCVLEAPADAALLDMREPWRVLGTVRSLTWPGSVVAAFLPTTNQVSQQVRSLEEAGCADLKVEEVLVRRYKPVPDRLRPEDQMTAHTGYVVSGRLVDTASEPLRWLSRERRRYAARQEAAHRYRRRLAEQGAAGLRDRGPGRLP